MDDEPEVGLWELRRHGLTGADKSHLAFMMKTKRLLGSFANTSRFFCVRFEFRIPLIGSSLY